MSNKQEQLYKEIKFEEYNSCHHIWVIDFYDYDSMEGRSYKQYGCIKCGLDWTVFRLKEECQGIYGLPLKEQVMYEYLTSDRIRNKNKSTIMSKVMCDLNLGQAIYAKIKQNHPNIDDETALRYFEIALANIRHNEVSEERKISRARRLSLSNNFCNWRGHDVQKL